MATIHTPVKGFVGVVAGVSFAAGVGESSDSSALAYFERQGYTVTVEGELPDPDSSDAGDITPPPADNEHVADGAELFEPKGNASVEEWRAYAVQKGHEVDAVADLKRDDIKALFTE